MSEGQLTSEKPIAILTTHHVLKLVAIVTMTMDHIGAYLYPEELWWRVAGRLTFPIFIFLVGHALTYRTKRDAWLWAVVLMVLSPVLGGEIFPLNALVTIIICQALLVQVEKRGWWENCPGTLLAGCVVLWFPTYVLTEYGAVGFLFALMGYAVRSGKLHTRAGYAVMLLAALGFVGSMSLSFEFTPVQMLCVALEITLATLLLARFTHRPVTLAWVPKGLQRAGLFLSRHSMQYYVVHRLLLQAGGMAMGVVTPALRWF